MKTTIARMNNKKMDETAIVFSKDCADKKRTARGVMARRKKMAEPMMTKAQIDAKHGPVSTFELHKPLNWAAFTQLPKDLQQEYLSGLVEKFNISTLDLTQLFGCKKSALSTYLNDKNLMLVVSAARDWNKPTDHEGWQNFCNQLWAPDKVKVVTATPAKHELQPLIQRIDNKKLKNGNAEKIDIVVSCIDRASKEYKTPYITLLKKLDICHQTYYRAKKHESVREATIDRMAQVVAGFVPSMAQAAGLPIADDRVQELHEKNNRAFAERIAEVAKKKNMSMRAVAKAIGLAESSLYNMRSGLVMSERFVNIASIRLDAFEEASNDADLNGSTIKISAGKKQEDNPAPASIEAKDAAEAVSVQKTAEFVGDDDKPKQKAVNEPTEVVVNDAYFGSVTLRGNAKAVIRALNKLLDGEDNTKEIEVKLVDFA